MLTERRPGVPGITIPRLLVIFVFCLFFQSDLPTQHQETHSTLNEKKKEDGLMWRKIPQNGKVGAPHSTAKIAKCLIFCSRAPVYTVRQGG